MNFILKITVVLTMSLIAHPSQSQELYSITVKVESVDSNKGKMFLAIYNTEITFLGTSYKGEISKIKNNQCTVTFKDIPSGTYAVSIFHDENDNGELDSNFFGIPKEDYGCSNNATGFMGPPKWEDAKFNLKDNKLITITL